MHLHVEFLDGQTREIPISDATVVTVKDPEHGEATVSMEGCTLIVGPWDRPESPLVEPGTHEVARSAQTGQFVTPEEAAANPDKTVIETIKDKLRGAR